MSKKITKKIKPCINLLALFEYIVWKTATKEHKKRNPLLTNSGAIGPEDRGGGLTLEGPRGGSLSYHTQVKKERPPACVSRGSGGT